MLIGKVRRNALWRGEPEPRRRNDISRLAPIESLLLAGPVAHAALSVRAPSGRGVRPTRPSRHDSGRRTRRNVLKTIIAPIRERANALLETRGELPIAHLTPHTLRRTFASLIAVCEVHPCRAMQLLGHTDAKFTMSVYQQDLVLGDGGLEALETALECTLDEARFILEAGKFSEPEQNRQKEGPAALR